MPASGVIAGLSSLHLSLSFFAVSQAYATFPLASHLTQLDEERQIKAKSLQGGSAHQRIVYSISSPENYLFTWIVYIARRCNEGWKKEFLHYRGPGSLLGSQLPSENYSLVMCYLNYFCSPPCYSPTPFVGSKGTQDHQLQGDLKSEPEKRTRPPKM